MRSPPINAEFRTIDQNARFHAMLEDIARQVEWDGAKHDKDWWKFVILGAAYGQQFVRNPFGEGFVCSNKRKSSGLYIPEMGDLITQLMAFGDERGVNWRDPEWVAYLRSIGEEEKTKIAQAA